MEFKVAFVQFLEFVRDHNLEGMKSFLDPQLPLKVLLPGRPLITEYNEFLDSQKPYFDNMEQNFDFVVLETRESGDFGFGVCQATLSAENKNSSRIQICFLFQRVDGQWKMVFDQNTILPSMK